LGVVNLLLLICDLLRRDGKADVLGEDLFVDVGDLVASDIGLQDPVLQLPLEPM